MIQVNLDCQYCGGTGQGIISNPPKTIVTKTNLKNHKLDIDFCLGSVRKVNCKCVVFAHLWNSNLIN